MCRWSSAGSVAGESVLSDSAAILQGQRSMMDNFMLISWIDRQLDRLSSEELEGQEHFRRCMTSQRRHVTSLKHKVNNMLSCMQHCVPPRLHYKAAESTQIGCCGLFLFLCSDWTLRALKLSGVTNL